MKHVPKHRGTRPSHLAVVAPKKALRNTLVCSSVAVAATGVTIGGGLLSGPTVSSAAAADASLSTGSAASGLTGTGGGDVQMSAAELKSARGPSLSRSFSRTATTDPVKAVALSASSGPAVTGSEDLSQADPKDVAQALLGQFGWSSDQFGCLDSLWTRESGWNLHAENASSGAYGIPQSLPGSKMASAGPDWESNAETQIKWGLGYIQDRYGSPCGAWGHSQSYGWY